MVLAHNERAEWRDQMKRGEIPERVQRSIELYKKLREDPCWRSTRMLECLGEAALLWYESQQPNNKNNKVENHVPRIESTASGQDNPFGEGDNETP